MKEIAIKLNNHFNEKRMFFIDGNTVRSFFWKVEVGSNSFFVHSTNTHDSGILGEAQTIEEIIALIEADN